MFDPSGQFELQVAPNGRAAADEYLHQGNMWIEGREGSRYVLRFANRSPQRVCVIFSVDGLDTIKGQPAGANSDGYVVDANSTLEIPGWKLDAQTAAEFYFNRIGKSYAAASGANTANVGVIGAMVFREQVLQQLPQYRLLTSGAVGLGAVNPSYSLSISQSGGSTGLTRGSPLQLTGSSWNAGSSALNNINSVGVNAVASSALSTTQDVGTGFGDATQFATAQTHFLRASPNVPDALLVIYYNSAKNLQKMGIQLRTRSTRYDNSTAKAFPAYDNGCTPPPGWKP